jgi:hypothetical protein
MKFRETDSTAGAGDSIPVKMQTRASRSIKATLALAILSLALFALPGPAFAAETCDNANGDATAGQYCTPVESLQAGLGAGGEQPAETVAVPVADNGPSLPFTGLDVAALAAVALALTGTGVVLRRLATIGDSEK